MGKILFKLKMKSLTLSMVFGKKHYMKRIVRIYRKAGVVFDGKPKYIDRNAKLDIFGGAKIYIGEGSVITVDTTILTHDYSIDCGLVAVGKQNNEREAVFEKDVHIGKNTFIGQKSIILPGVTIGDNCIIGAGAVVSKDIPDNSIVVGCPCKIIADTKEWANKKIEEKSFVLGDKRR